MQVLLIISIFTHFICISNRIENQNLEFTQNFHLLSIYFID